MRCLKPEKVAAMQKSAQPQPNGELPSHWLSVFRSTQRLLERLHRRERKLLLKYEPSTTRPMKKWAWTPISSSPTDAPASCRAGCACRFSSYVGSCREVHGRHSLPYWCD